MKWIKLAFAFILRCFFKVVKFVCYWLFEFGVWGLDLKIIKNVGKNKDDNTPEPGTPEVTE